MKKYQENVTGLINDAKVNKALSSLNGSISQSVSAGIALTGELQSALKMYQESLNDYVQLSTEKNTISAKYSSDNPGNSYTLPGVYSSASSGFDLQQMKIDNQRITEIAALLEQAESQKELYFKMVSNSSQKLAKELNSITRASLNLEAFLSQLEMYSSFENNISKNK